MITSVQLSDLSEKPFVCGVEGAILGVADKTVFYTLITLFFCLRNTTATLQLPENLLFAVS
jgi:hypothetical protein